MSDHEKLNYVEFPACDLPATKAFLVVYLIGSLLTTAQNTRRLVAKGSMVAFLMRRLNR